MAARMMLFGLAALLASPFAAAMLPDPTAPPALPGAAEAVAGDMDGSSMSLTAIKTTGGRRMAVIGGREVVVGEHYQGARVVRIGESQVLLRRGRETLVLELYPQVEKRLRGHTAR